MIHATTEQPGAAWRWRWPLAIFVLALALRLFWVLQVHPPADFIYSDMSGYVARAHRLLGEPFLAVFPDEGFYPVGTHYLLALPLWIFGHHAYGAAAIMWATMNALLAPLAYLLGGRLFGGPRYDQPVDKVDEDDNPDVSPARAAHERYAMGVAVARVSGGFVAIYYPLLAYSGYFLSETPFALSMAAAAWLGLRLIDHGRARDALWLGVAVAIGASMRPQLIVGFVLFAAFVVWRRRFFPALSDLGRCGRVLASSLAPIALVVAFSLWHTHHHTGKASVLSSNGALNRVFGRCHNRRIYTRTSMFGLPAFGALLRAEEVNPDIWFKLSPTREEEIRAPMYRIWEQEKMDRLSDDCVKRSGYLKQMYYAATHISLLWGYNVAWPDSAQARFRGHMHGWSRAHMIVFLIPALIAMAMGASRQWPRWGAVTMYLWSMFTVAALVVGSARLRVPYDFIGIILALCVFGKLATFVHFQLRARRIRKSQGGTGRPTA